MIAIGIFVGFVAGVAAWMFCEYLIQKYPNFFHSQTP
jgi:hypothetical protein